MERGWYFRALLVLGVCGLALYLLYPSYYYYFQASEAEKNDNTLFCNALPAGFDCTKFNLGLDLQGGVQVVMGVRVDRAVEQRVDRLSEALTDGLKEAGISVASIVRTKDKPEILLTLSDAGAADAIETYLRKDLPILRLMSRSGNVWTLGLDTQEAEYVRDMAVEQAIKTIRNRADKLGVTEPTIARRGDDNVLIQLPGVKDPARAIDVIGRMAQLEFTIVDGEGTTVFDGVDATTLPEGTTKRETSSEGPKGPVREVFFEFAESQQDAVVAALAAVVPADRKVGVGFLNPDAPAGTPKTMRTYLLHARPGITGDYLTDARVQQDPELPSNYYVTMTFDPKGAKIFERLTEENVQRHMAIVLDGKVNSAPVIQEKIGGGTARITLGGAGDAQKKFQEAKDLALVLKAGALPAPVEIREKRQVGKTLGQDSVRNGTYAMLAGTLLVILFMLLYYKASGIIANIALLVNVALILAMLALFEATLTLPGMAGIVLIIGMAVDANVIIFERIKEELALGKTPRAAIDAGYSKAFSTILDSNLTTLIAGIVLMQYGSGPVRGFAVTLIVGILCSMFTAIVVTRLIYDFFTGRRRLQTLSI